MTVLDLCTLTYYAIPGRGEASRLALTLGGVKFTDDRVPFKEWPERKPKTPWGGIPVLTLADGQQIGQGRSILRFIGKVVGLYPTDPLLACRCDELMDCVEDVVVAVNGLGAGLEKEAKMAKREEWSLQGNGATTLAKIDAFITTHGKGSGFAVGDTLTIADLFVFTLIGQLTTGVFDGVPATLLDKYAAIQALRKAVATYPAVAAYYDAQESPPAFLSSVARAL